MYWAHPMDDLVGSYYGMYGCTVSKEIFPYAERIRYHIKEAVDTEAIKKNIEKGAAKAGNPKLDRKDVETLHDKRREEVKKMVKEESKKGSVKTTFLPKSRERDIGRHDDWKDPHPDTKNWGQDSPAKQKLKRRMTAVIGTRRREDRESGLRKEEMDLILSYLLDNGFAKNEQAAENIMEAMSEQWIQYILDEEVH
jgi:hypothetical protein